MILGPPEVGPCPGVQPVPVLFAVEFAALQRILPKVLAYPELFQGYVFGRKADMRVLSGQVLQISTHGVTAINTHCVLSAPEVGRQ